MLGNPAVAQGTKFVNVGGTFGEDNHHQRDNASHDRHHRSYPSHSAVSVKHRGPLVRRSEQAGSPLEIVLRMAGTTESDCTVLHMLATPLAEFLSRSTSSADPAKTGTQAEAMAPARC